MSHNIILTEEDGIHNLYVFGSNVTGELGIADKNKRLVSIPTKLLLSEQRYEVINIHLQLGTSIIETNIGIFVFGANYVSQLGVGDDWCLYSPVKLSLSNDFPKIKKICGGCNHTVIQTINNELWGFGKNLGNFGEISCPRGCEVKTPTKLNFLTKANLTSEDLIDISCGDNYTILHTTKGLLRFGSGFEYQWDDRDEFDFLRFPVLPTEICDIYSHCEYNIVKTIDGFWGFGTKRFNHIFSDGSDLSKLNWKDEVYNIKHGTSFVIFQTFEGLWECGYYPDNVPYYTISDILNESELGYDFLENHKPHLLEIPGDIIAFSCMRHHTVTLTTEGLYVHGSNTWGELGLGHQEFCENPVKLNIPGNILNINGVPITYHSNLFNIPK